MDYLASKDSEICLLTFYNLIVDKNNSIDVKLLN